MKASTWKCPTCSRWVAEFMSIRCAACRILLPPVVRAAVEEPVVVAAAVEVMEPVAVVPEAVAAAVVASAKGVCACCGKRHWHAADPARSAASFRQRIAEGKAKLNPAAIAWLAQHEGAAS